MQCRFCEERTKLVKAHIIPEAFFRVLRTTEEPPVMVSDQPNNFPKRSPIGVYDEHILCERCEPKFDRVDNYGTDVLLNRRDELFQPVFRDGRTIAYQASEVNQKLLLQFFVATLWRASVSGHDFYRRVALGPYEELARNVVENPDSAVPDVFAVVLSRWNAAEERQTMANALMDPFREKWQGVNAYRMYFGQVTAYIKVDQCPLPSPFRQRSLLAQDEVTMVARDFIQSNDYAALKNTATMSHRNVELARGKRGIGLHGPLKER